MNATPQPLRIYGVRHHGPGSARSLALALEANPPDCILVEGPPDAASVLALLGDAELAFPVALLIYAPDAPRKAVYYPFAEYSPETIALRFALERGIPVRFMDLPMTHVLARAEAKPLEIPAEPTPEAEAEPEAAFEPEEKIEVTTEAEAEAEAEAEPEEEPEAAPDFVSPRADPLQWLAQAAGYEDSERWWEDLVEHRRDESGIFAAVLEAMTALRLEMDAAAPRQGESAIEEEQREAWMRNTIRAAQKEGFENIAVVCGAWHTPALAGTLNGPVTAKADTATLKGLPKIKVEATWVPWTNDRLSFRSGYGAGIESPGWYQHLWACRDLQPEEVAPRWMALVAALMRAEDLDASSAHLIEAVRLAQTLAALRGHAIPALEELNEATRAVLGFGDDVVLRLIARKLIVGERMGAVPESAPATPLQQDLAREQKRLRFAPDATQKVLDLDLRKPGDLDRSRLLHRLQILEIPWGALERGRTGKGTFHEIWRVQWEPELAIRVIQAGIWGSSVAGASAGKAVHNALATDELPSLSSLLDAVLLADLGEAIAPVMKRVEDVAATSNDAAHLMDAMPPLARIYRYGDVRGTKVDAVAPILEGIATRLWINLPPACSAQNDEAAREYLPKLQAVAGALSIWNNDEANQNWQGALQAIARRESMPGLLAGLAGRLLLDAGALDDEQIASLLALSLSSANEPARVAAWIEGFLGQSGLLLLHDDRLWNAIDEWVCSLTPEAFIPILPLLRRTWSQFPAGERRNMGERVRQASSSSQRASSVDGENFDWERAQSVLPVLSKLLGVPLEA